MLSVFRQTLAGYRTGILAVSLGLFGISIMLSSHLMGEVEQTCDRIIVLEGGRVTEQGEVAGFTQDTQTLVIDVDDNQSALVAALAKRGIPATIEGFSVIIEQDNDEQYDAVRDALVESEARLRRLAPRRHTLTDIFRGPARS